MTAHETRQYNTDSEEIGLDAFNKLHAQNDATNHDEDLYLAVHWHGFERYRCLVVERVSLVGLLNRTKAETIVTKYLLVESVLGG